MVLSINIVCVWGGGNGQNIFQFVFNVFSKSVDVLTIEILSHENLITAIVVNLHIDL